MSLIQSNYMGFGSGVVVPGTGKPLPPLTMTGDAIQLEYSAGETLRVKAEWL